jgi:hypothetical protein
MATIKKAPPKTPARKPGKNIFAGASDVYTTKTSIVRHDYKHEPIRNREGKVTGFRTIFSKRRYYDKKDPKICEQAYQYWYGQ